MKYENIRNIKDVYEWLWTTPAAKRLPEKVYGLLQYVITPRDLVTIAEKIQVRLPPEKEVVVAQDIEQACRYAEKTLKGPFPQAEALLASDIRYGLRYAKNALKGPFPAIEALLCAGPWEALTAYVDKYARTRFPESEARILLDPRAAFTYAEFVLKAPWPEAEPLLAQDAQWGIMYALSVRLDRWPEFEPSLFSLDAQGTPKHFIDALKYANRHDIMLPASIHDQFESCLLRCGQYNGPPYQDEALLYAYQHKLNIDVIHTWALRGPLALDYVRTVSQRRWPAMEPVFARSFTNALDYAKTIGRPFTLGERNIFSKPSGPTRYYTLLKKMPASEERDVAMLLAVGYARHREAPEVFQAKGLNYAALWPLWEGLELDLEERRRLLSSLMRPHQMGAMVATLEEPDFGPGTQP